MIRLFVTGPLVEGGAVELDEARMHYLSRVMRQPVGAELRLFDGISGEHAATVAEYRKRSTVLAVGAQVRPLPADMAGPVLFQAVIKRPRYEWLVEKATELGAGRIVAVRTRRAGAALGRLDRLGTIAIEAAEQCHRLDVPTLDEEVPLAAIGQLRRADTPLLVLDPAAEAAAIDVAIAHQGRVDLVVGPEGGFDPADLAVLERMANVMRGRLASTVLRAETAAISGLAVIEAARCR